MMEGLTNNTVLICRNLVRNSLHDKKIQEKDILIGYIYEADGRYRKYYLPSSVQNIGNFICSDYKDKMITDSADYAILNTMGNIIDLSICEQKYFDELLKYIIPIQKKSITTKFISIDS